MDTFFFIRYNYFHVIVSAFTPPIYIYVKVNKQQKKKPLNIDMLKQVPVWTEMVTMGEEKNNTFNLFWC